MNKFIEYGCYAVIIFGFIWMFYSLVVVAML